MSSVGSSPEFIDLKGLIAPRSAALVGATDHPTSFGGRVFRQMTNFGFPGKIYPVNPRLRAIEGYRCFPSVRDLPETPDHVGIIVSSERVFDVLADCAAIGVKFATVYTGGFAEMGTPEGKERQARLVRFARDSGIRIMGPNCNGVVNFVDAFAMTSTAAIKGARLPPGNVGIVSHSGGLGQINVMWRAQQIGLRVSYQASCGNEADLDTLDFVRFMLRSDETDVVLLAVEGIKDRRKLEAVAREAVEREKPIIVLKFGRTAAGVRAAACHTGAVAGDDAIYEGIFRQYGMIRVHECNELYETAVLLRQRHWPRSANAAAVSPTGGNIVQVADVGANFGISWPPYSPKTQEALSQLLPGYGKVANPTDMTSLATGDQALYRSALNAIAADENVEFVIPIFASVGKSDLQRGAEYLKSSSKPAAMLWVGGCTDDASYTPQLLVNEGLPVYRDATPCLRALRAAVDFGRHVEAFRTGGAPRHVRPHGTNVDAAKALLARCGAKLTEREAKEVLASYGFPVTKERLARNSGEAVAIAREIGAPVAMKIDSPDIGHKTEARALRLSVAGDEEILRAYDEIVRNAKSYSPQAHVNGVLVQEMVRAGVELMLGFISDQTFGPVIAVGLGGIYVEVLKDLAYRAAPITQAQANDMLCDLLAVKLLQGVRGMPPRDVKALIDTIVRLSWFAYDFSDRIAELDMNPVVIDEQGAGLRVVDALMVRATSNNEEAI